MGTMVKKRAKKRKRIGTMVRERATAKVSMRGGAEMRSRAKARTPASQRLPENMVTAIVSTVHSNAGGDVALLSVSKASCTRQ